MVENSTDNSKPSAVNRMRTSAKWTNIMELASMYDNFLFDCDGVLWSANNQIGSAFETIEELERMGKKVFFITNNATKLQPQCGTKMTNMGYKNLKLENIYTSASVISKYVVRKYPNVRKVFCIGMKSVRDSLEGEGIEVIGADQHIFPPDVEVSETEFDNYQLDPDVGAVVFGLDMSFTH